MIMKLDKVYVIEDAEVDKVLNYGHGGEITHLTKEHIEELQKGKSLAFYDGEYTHILTLKEGE